MSLGHQILIVINARQILAARQPGMEPGLAANLSVVTRDSDTVAAARSRMRRLQRRNARAHHHDVLGGRHQIRLPVVLVGGAHSGIVVAGQPVAIDNAAPAGVARHAVADISLPTLLTLVWEGGVGDQWTSQKDQIGSTVRQCGLAFIGIGDVANRTRGDIGRNRS